MRAVLEKVGDRYNALVADQCATARSWGTCGDAHTSLSQPEHQNLVLACTAHQSLGQYTTFYLVVGPKAHTSPRRTVSLHR